MNGFTIMTEALKKTETKAGTFKLLAEEDDFEVFESNIKAGKSILFQPHECKDALNIAMIISGRLYHTNTGRYIISGERIIYKDIDETHHLSVLEDSKLLMIRRKKLLNNQINMTERVSDLLHEIQVTDQYTEEHCNRTGNIAVQIAIHLKLPEEVIENVLYVGKIHDVGKINISGDVLKKPGRLSTEEFEWIKTHSKAGHDIVVERLQNSHFARIVLEHHEKLDGSGYPNRLKENEISIEAKVILVADAFDAMTSDRPYRTAMSNNEALKELNKYSGIWYDYDVVEAINYLVLKKEIKL